VRDKVEIVLTRTRSSGYLNLDEAIYRFYAARLLPAGAATPSLPVKRGISDSLVVPAVASVPELIDLVRERRLTDPRFLFFEADDLRGSEEAAHDAAAFPAALPVENRVLPLDYAYRPGQDDDGVTITVSVRDAADLTPAALDWAVPGHLEEKVLHLLKALPTGQRRTLIPLAETAKAAARAVAGQARLRGRQDTLAESLAGYLRETHKLAVDVHVWADKPLPDHLRVRVQVVDGRGQTLAASRDLADLQRRLEDHQRQLSVEIAREDPAAWGRARARWERDGQTGWTFGEIPARVHVCDQAGVPVHAYPALVPVDAGVALRLLKTPEEAQAALRQGLFHLFELQLRYELAWLQRDLRDLRALGVLGVCTAGGAADRRGLCARAGAHPGGPARGGAAPGGFIARNPHAAPGAVDASAALSRSRGGFGGAAAGRFHRRDAIRTTGPLAAVPAGDAPARGALETKSGTRCAACEAAGIVWEGVGGVAAGRNCRGGGWPLPLVGGGVSGQLVCAGIGHGRAGFPGET
jgi:ATP-dependent helicase HrpA